LRKTRILVVSSRSFSRIVKHLFRGQSEFEVVGVLSGFGSLGRQAGQLLPDLIVANVKPVSIGIRRVVATIKQASPSAKVILTCAVEDFARAARKHGADACLNDEDVAGHLLRMACALSDRPKVVNAGN
jgi:DNA-binding NarL/FixJ family response regulator